MRKQYYLFFVVIFGLLSSCGTKVSEADLTHLAGYWEITKVLLPDGQERDYSINTSVDYFEFAEGVQLGVRQKVMPQFNGEYLTNDIVEKFEVERVDNQLWLLYTTDYARWKERIVYLTEDELEVENEQGLTYFYKRYEGFSLK